MRKVTVAITILVDDDDTRPERWISESVDMNLNMDSGEKILDVYTLSDESLIVD